MCTHYDGAELEARVAELEDRVERLREAIRQLRNCALPDPHDEREIDLNWLVRKILNISSAALQREGE